MTAQALTGTPEAKLRPPGEVMRLARMGASFQTRISFMRRLIRRMHRERWHMDYDALCDKLEDGSLAGAILDVFNTEPISASSRLWNTRNLIITPHVSADDGDAYVPMTINLFLRNMELHLAGKPLLNPVRPELGY